MIQPGGTRGLSDPPVILWMPSDAVEIGAAHRQDAA